MSVTHCQPLDLVTYGHTYRETERERVCVGLPVCVLQADGWMDGWMDGCLRSSTSVWCIRRLASTQILFVRHPAHTTTQHNTTRHNTSPMCVCICVYGVDGVYGNALRSATVVLPCQDSLTHPYRLRLTSRHVYDLVGVRLRDIGRRRTMTDDVSRWILTRSMPMKTIHQDIHHEPHEPSMLSAAIPVLTPRNQLCHCICCRHHPLSDSQVLT